MATWIPWGFYLLAWVASLLMYAFHFCSFPQTLLLFVVFFSGGFQGLWVAAGHLLMPKKFATAMGLKPSSSQIEIVAINLAIGVVSILSITQSLLWITPVALILIIFYAVHFYTYIKARLGRRRSKAAGHHSASMMYNSITIALTLTLLLGFTYL